MKYLQIILLAIVLISIGFYFGVQYNKFIYHDICLDIGGGINPGGYPICVIEK